LQTDLAINQDQVTPKCVKTACDKEFSDFGKSTAYKGTHTNNKVSVKDFQAQSAATAESKK